MKKVYSFDIFDTCLVRTCGKPYFVFQLLAEKILESSSSQFEALCNDFAWERKQGELRALKCLTHSGKEDVTLEEIYRFCDFSFATTMSSNDIMQQEMDVERSVLVAVKDTVTKVRRLRDAGYQIMFISDMYLPTSFVLSVLRDKSILEDGDLLYISCEWGKCKHTGSLFKFIHEQNGTEYKNWYHEGDNYIADYKVPKRLGIKCKHTEYHLTRYEKNTYDKDFESARLNVQMMAMLSRAVRLNIGDVPKVRFAADFIAPLYVPYVYHVLEEATIRKIDKLYFLARDGWIFYQIAKVLWPLFPLLELRYLYVSRKSLYLPGTENIDLHAIGRMMGGEITAKSKWKLVDILDMLQMEDFDYSKIENTGKDILEKLTCLLNDKTFSCRLNELQCHQRESSLAYFKQEGLANGNNAIVDLTGTRHCHKMLNNILVKGGCQPVFGFYFEVDYRRNYGKEYSALYFQELYTHNKINCQVRPHMLFEQYFSITNQKRTKGYSLEDGIAKPVFENESMDETFKETTLRVNEKVCREYASHYMQMLGKANHPLLCNVSMSVWSYFYKVPDKAYLKALDGMCFTLSKVRAFPLLIKMCFVKAVVTKSEWYWGNLVHNTFFPGLLMGILEKNYKRTNYPNETADNFVGKIINKFIKCYKKGRNNIFD